MVVDFSHLFFCLLNLITIFIDKVTSYIVLFRYIWKHNNKTATNILDTKAINLRNRANAISLTGLFATWGLEVCYFICGGLLSIVVTDSNFIREFVAALIPFEYYFIPLVQIYTSAPIKNLNQKTKMLQTA